jgi:hypothetical protein
MIRDLLEMVLGAYQSALLTNILVGVLIHYLKQNSSK